MKIKSLVTAVALTCAISGWAAQPRYIFYFIGDGMGMGPVMAAATYNRTVLGSDELPLMMTFPVASQAMTYSASTPVTDSAAAGTALSTGHKTKNGMLGMNPDTVAVYSMAEVLADNGYGVGVITTVAPDDATPGAFYAHVPKRSMYTDINRQFVDSKIDFLAGSDLRGLKDKEGNDTGVLSLYKKNNVKIARGLDEYKALDKTSGKIILLDKEPFQAGNVGYTIDSINGMLTLPQMTQTCLEFLEKKTPNRFFMMVEGGNIDHALHGNDGGAAIIEIFNFNEALKIAYDFYLAHPDETLIVVTADHDTGGMTVGNGANGYRVFFNYLKSQKVSKEMFSDYCKGILKSRRVYTWDDMKEYLEENLGFWSVIPLKEKETEKLKEAFVKVFDKRESKDQKTLYNDFNSFAKDVFSLLSTKAAIGWTTTGHSGNPVPVYAIGQGAEKFMQINNNIQIPARILESAGYELKK
ncbi:MAG: alkaline phosphatase [Muribaculaceae bacterium]|nr:alkaline phosphatase [Muribaculaceae bacterium]